MAASAIWIDRPVERQVVAGDVIDDRLRFDLDELDAAELGCVEGPSADLEQGLALHPDMIEHTFEQSPTV